MRIPHLTRAVTTVVAVVATTATVLAAPAHAATGGAQADVQRQVDQVVAGHPGAQQTGSGTVRFADGVELTIPAAGSTAGVCDAGAYCFFQWDDYEGRKLTFRDCGPTGLWQYLTDYGFGNYTTSWQNYTDHTVVVYDQATAPPTHLWTENPGAESTYVGPSVDNKADSFQTYCG
ncbi:peptidase inhibitor family I36 protein [Actinomadura sp. 7K507]|uniref:peptidase inhibitor family I36 protein n=1 Tax=Actinomadura sp. 7K507 TaxID=2530365 RepID=UPI0010454032|nr:peptidase inhibitor family I36 protein [Actinomadura sp. 7K507]TDC97729.1 hypothetical protein E1285_02580 [Actinomadura sp. 7K507]